MRKILFGLFVIVFMSGCLNSAGPQTISKKTAPDKKDVPVVVPVLLGDKLAENFANERKAISLAVIGIAERMESATPLTPAEQKEAWEQTDLIRETYAKANASLIQEGFAGSKTPREVAAVWREVARGYYAGK